MAQSFQFLAQGQPVLLVPLALGGALDSQPLFHLLGLSGGVMGKQRTLGRKAAAEEGVVALAETLVSASFLGMATSTGYSTNSAMNFPRQYPHAMNQLSLGKVA